MVVAIDGFADDDHYNMLATAKGPEPAGKQPCVGETGTPAHLVWIGQDVGDALTMFRKQVRMPFGNVLFSFVGQLHLSVQAWTGESCHLPDVALGRRCLRPTQVASSQ